MLSIYRQLFALLDAAERRQLFGLLALVVVMAVVDVIGVAAVLPFLAVAADPGVVRESAFLSVLYEMSGVDSDRTFVVLLGVGVFGFILLGLVVKVLGQYRIIHFVHLRNHSLSSRLLKQYLRHPYAWFLNRNSANLGAAILAECDKVVGTAMVPAMRIVAQSVSLIFLLALLILVNPVVALAAVMGLGGAYGAIFLYVRRQLNLFGIRQLAMNAARHRMALEAFGGIKDVKLLGLEDRYARRYDVPARAFAESAAASQVIGELPRFLLEAIAFGGLVLMILGLLILQNGNVQDILPVLGVFGFAVLKIFPAVQQIYHAMTQLRFISPMVKKLHGELCADSPPAEDPATRAPAAPLPLRDRIELSDLRFSYSGTAAPVLDGLSLSIKARTTVGIVGGTGAGKTTAVDVLLGLLMPDSGTITVDGQALTAANMAAWQASIGYVPQQIYLTDDSIAANIAFGVPPELQDRAAIERASRLAELHDFVTGDLTQGYDTIVGERGVRLSGGQRQRIGIARALYRDPEVLIFDEATSALDTLTERAVMAAVKNLGHSKTIIMIAHRLSTVKACDTIFLIQGGRLLAQGTFDTLVAESEVFRRMAS